MNDPHVKALYYSVIVGKDVDYDNAQPLLENTDEFEFSLEQNSAVFTMKKHYASVDEAKSVVEEYLRSWYILIGLEHGPDDLQLKFSHTDIIDRAPSTGKKVINLQAHCLIQSHASDTVSLHISKNKYPDFPKNFRASVDVETMYTRYKSYLQGRETLTSMAYMCLTILETGAGGRKKAGKQYNIEYGVLDTLGNLTSSKGGPEDARKFPKDGKYDPLHYKERAWIEYVIKALIRRTGEYAYNSKGKLKQLSLKDFPDLAIP
jgi:hypothetical protein